MTTSTDADGNYRFADLPVGTYEVSFTTSTLPTGYAATDVTISADIVIGNDTDVADVDFGANRRGSVGDTVFYDLNGNGTQDAGEPGLAGVTVALLDDTGAPILSGGVPVTAVTAAGGSYTFDDLLADDYQVEVDTATLPANAAYTTAGDENQPVTVPVAATPSTDVDIDTIDFGVDGDASLGDRVYLDLNGDGDQDIGDTTGVSGITVELLYAGAVIATDVTDAERQLRLREPARRRPLRAD